MTVVIRINAIINFKVEGSVAVQSARRDSSGPGIHGADMCQGQEQ